MGPTEPVLFLHFVPSLTVLLFWLRKVPLGWATRKCQSPSSHQWCGDHPLCTTFIHSFTFPLSHTRKRLHTSPSQWWALLSVARDRPKVWTPPDTDWGSLRAVFKRHAYTHTCTNPSAHKHPWLAVNISNPWEQDSNRFLPNRARKIK